MLIRSQIRSSLDACLENSKVVIELTELSDEQTVYISLITGYSQELLSDNQIELIIETPLEVCILNG